MRTNRLSVALLSALFLFAVEVLCFAQDDPQLLTAEQKREFLLHAKIIEGERVGKGITNPYRLTLSDGKISHYGLFQSINERRTHKELSTGGEMNFVDSYLYNIAAYELAKLIGLDNMLPVTVLRKWQRKPGSLSWWLPVQMDEGERQKKKIHPPNLTEWNNSMFKVRVFTELIFDTDRSNPGNILIGNDFEVYMIDFSRAFRLYHHLKNPKNLVRCDRNLLEKLRALDAEEWKARAGDYLTSLELKGVMKRRDKIVEYLEKLIAEKGEYAVLY